MARLTIGWLHVIILLGAAQGLFLSVALATKRRNRNANRLLAAAMLVFSVGLLTTVYHAVGLERVLPHFFGVGYPLPFLYGPLVYLYAVTAADRDRRLTRRDALHLLPFLATVVAALPIYLSSGPGKIEFYQRLLAGERPLLLLIADPMKLVSGVIYATITILFLRTHRERVKESYSSTERVNLRWLLWLSAAAASIWLLAVLLEIFDSTGIADLGNGDDIISLAVAAFVYAIGYRGLQQPEVFRYETGEWPALSVKQVPQLVAAPPAETVAAEEPEPAPAPRYERSGLTDREARRLAQALADVMEREQPWKDSELTLADLAARLGASPHRVSEVLNAQVGQTFYDFVNGYRVREVQRRIAAGEAQNLKMLALAFEAGFASKSTFNEVFKRHTSQTPSGFRRAAGA